MSGYRTKKMATPRRNRGVNSGYNVLPPQSQASSLAVEAVYIAEMAKENIFAGSSFRLHNESLIDGLHSPKSRLRRALEVGRDAISVLRELDDITLSERSTPTLSTVLAVEKNTLVRQSTADVRTPTQANALLQARLALSGESADRSSSRLRMPLRQQTPLQPTIHDVKAGPANVTYNTSSVNSNSPAVMRSPLQASTPISAARQLRQSKLANNSMDDSEFDLLLTTAIGMTGDDYVSLAPPMVDPVLELPAVDENLSLPSISRRPSQRRMNDSMDDSFMNALLCSQACAFSRSPTGMAAAATSAIRAMPPTRPEDEDDEIVVIEQPHHTTFSIDVKLLPSAARPVFEPKLTRHSSHMERTTTLTSSPTSSRPGRTVEMATRMRRHRSLIEEMKVSNVAKQLANAGSEPSQGHPIAPAATVVQPPARVSPAFNSTLLKPSTLQRYMDRTMQQPPKPSHGRNHTIPSKLNNSMNQEWMSKRASQSVANVRPSLYARKRPLGAIENHVSAPSPTSRKRTSKDTEATTTRAAGQPATPVPLKRPPRYNEVDNVIFVDEPLGTTVTTPTVGGFISKRLASNMIRATTPTPATVIECVPPKDDTFYDDDIEFLV